MRLRVGGRGHDRGLTALDASSARELFDTNARTYDRVNAVISLGLDSRWRRWAASRAFVGERSRVLDAFAGTGEVGLRVAALGADVTLADISPVMLELARERAQARGLSISTVAADLTRDPLLVEGAPFDVVTAMWGVRYVDDRERVIRNLAVQLASGGRLVLVDFVEPGPGLISKLAALYFFRILPKLASRLAGRGELYSQLITTTHSMGSAEQFAGVITASGLEIVETHSMGFGLVLGIVAKRAAVPAPHN